MAEENSVFQQDLSSEEHPGAVFVMKFLMKEAAELPPRETLVEVMRKHLGEVDCFWHDEKGTGIAAKRYTAHFKDVDAPPQLLITPACPFDGEGIGEFQRSQMWDCQEDRDRILEECRYQVMASDILAATLPAKERAELDMDFLEALAELFPTAEGVYFHTSGKLFSMKKVREHKVPREDRFLYFAVNARFFNIQGTQDMLVDTLGMSTLFLPDVQYHFHDMDPNWVVNHAYNMASYIFENGDPIDDGDTIDGIEGGALSQRVQWPCRRESSLIQPSRLVIDIEMGDYASGARGGEEEPQP